MSLRMKDGEICLYLTSTVNGWPESSLLRVPACAALLTAKSTVKNSDTYQTESFFLSKFWMLSL